MAQHSARPIPDRYLEQQLTSQGLGPVAGVDEAGRGACAGPLVAAAVIFGDNAVPVLPHLRDSKQLSPTRRQQLAAEIVDQAVSVAWVTVDAADCDRWGLQAANLTALRQAIEALTVTPGYVISDGYAIDGLSMPSRRVIRGDQQIACVAAASIIAKVNRDRIMIDLDRQFPGYGFAGHKGYGTLAHQSVLERLGPSPQHRMSYRNVAKATRVG